MPFPKPPGFPFPDFKKVIERIINAGKYAWSVITGQDSKQDEIASKKSLNPEKSDVSEIAELNRLLNEYRQNIISAGSEIEREMIVECSMEIQEIMDVFEEFNRELKIARSDSIKRKFKHMNSELKGTFADYIEKKFSLDNSECIKILKLPAGDLKNQRLQEMKQNVFIAAKNEMIDKIKYAVSDFYDTVEDAFSEHLDRAAESIEDKKSTFEKMSMATEEDAESIESVLLQSDYILSVCYYAETL